MNELEAIQKRLIEMQDAEIVRLRMEVDRLKFELSKLRVDKMPSAPSFPSVTMPTHVPFWETDKYVWISEPPKWTVTCENASSDSTMKKAKTEK